MGLPGRQAQIYVEKSWLDGEDAPIYPAGSWEHLQRVVDIRYQSEREAIGFRPRDSTQSTIGQNYTPNRYYRYSGVEFEFTFGYRKHFEGDVDYASLLNAYRNAVTLLVLIVDAPITGSTAIGGWQFPAIITNYRESWPLGGAQLSRFDLLTAYARDSNENQITIQQISVPP